MFGLYTDYLVRSLSVAFNLEAVKLGVGRWGRLCLFPSMLCSDLHGHQLGREMNERRNGGCEFLSQAITQKPRQAGSWRCSATVQASASWPSSYNPEHTKAQDHTQEPQPWSLNDALTHLVSALLSKGTAEPGKAPRAGAGARDNLPVINSHNY